MRSKILYVFGKIVWNVLLASFTPIYMAYAEECPEGYYPVKSHPRNAYQRQDGTPVSSATVKEQCRPYRILKLPEPKFISTMPFGWPNSKEKFKPWNKAEELQVREALKMLPKNLTHIGDIKFHRAISDSNLPNPSVSSSENKIITIYDSIDVHDLKRVIGHELAHFFWDSLSQREQADYFKAARWKIDKKLNLMTVQRTQFAIPDSVIGPGEDFANNVELLLFDKKALSNESEILKCIERMIK